jgi:hypothetical protein
MQIAIEIQSSLCDFRGIGCQAPFLLSPTLRLARKTVFKLVDRSDVAQCASGLVSAATRIPGFWDRSPKCIGGGWKSIPGIGFKTGVRVLYSSKSDQHRGTALSLSAGPDMTISVETSPSASPQRIFPSASPHSTYHTVCPC